MLGIHNRFPLTIPNQITLFRLLLVLGIAYSVLCAPASIQIWNPLALLIAIALDGLDGYFARRLRQESLFGALFDIAVDHIIELILWVVLAKIGLVPMWVVMTVIVRDILVDAIRSGYAQKGKAPFEAVFSKLGAILVSSKIMRGFYGFAKAIAFAWLLWIQPLPLLFPAFWELYGEVFLQVSSLLIYLSWSLCVLRAIPVVAQSLVEAQ